MTSRSPHGERGLKYIEIHGTNRIFSSLPTRGAWIEIELRHIAFVRFQGRSPHGERGLKLMRQSAISTAIPSLPTRGAWIEIALASSYDTTIQVAPHTGSVD